MSVEITRLASGAEDMALTAMRCALWPQEDAAELAQETGPLLKRADYAVFGARDGGQWIGFVEVGERDVGEGCTTSPVGYVEALWVAPEARRRGIGRALVGAAIAWARDRGLREICSDTQLWNVESQETHLRLGFVETERLVTYRKEIG